ncbi:MAG: metal ABC transporter substrate-binding protein, partial [Planctomycetota bacterium]
RHIDRTSPETARVGHANARTNSDPLSLPFFDDFSTAVDVPDTNLWEYGEHVFINNSLGENPPSLNVATFDGAQRNGTPYQLSEEKPGPTDSLISRVIDLSNIPSSEQPDIFISFYWHLRGLGEIHESVDSIPLQLLAADSVWYAVWSAQGGFNNLDTAFKRFNYEEINVQRLEGPDRVFFHDNFRLRFQAYSTFRGIFDTWNIDYVYINRLSRMPVLNSPGIFRILDRSLSGNTTPLFAPYYEVPSSQVPATFEEQVFGMSNLDIGDLHPVVFTHTLRNMNSNAVIARLEVTEGIPSLRAGEIRRIAGIPGGPFPAIEDSTVIMSEFIYVSGDTLLQERTRLTQDTVFYPSPTLELNDTLRQTYLLHQHYAYDDGTAEFSAGINLDQGQVAVQFVSRELDTLTHIDVHFPVPDDLDPAFWNPDVASVTAFQQADLILLNGASYAKWIRRNSLPDSKLLNTSAEARQQYIYVDDAVTHQHGPDGEHSHGELASTTWLDFQLAGMQAESICNALSELMPDHATAFESQFVSLKTELEKLDQALLSVAEDQRALPVIGSHPVYQYLASRYALNLKNVHWEPDQMPDEAEWSKLGDMLERHPAKTMLWEVEPLPGIRSKLDGMGLQSIVFNPTGNVPSQGDFLKAMQQNVARLTEILESP